MPGIRKLSGTRGFQITRDARRAFIALGAMAAASQLAVQPALAQSPASATATLAAAFARPAPKCSVSPGAVRFDQPLSRLAMRLSGGLPIKIVAIGSSSTAGAGASSPSATYPSRLEAELNRHFPGHELTVLNRGVNGEEAPDMLARFETSVIAEHPDLVIWQVGTNSLLRDRPIDARATVLHEGLARLKAVRADVILMDMQYAPKVLAKATREAMIAQISEVAKQEKVDLLHRFAIMRDWHETDGLSFDAFIKPDELHMNDWGYACIAKWLGVAIAEASTRPTETAAVPLPGR